MNELPESWTTATLDELLAAIVGGGTPSKSKKSYFQGTIPFMTVKDMHVRFIEDTQDHITQEALDDSASTLIPADTLVVATRMSLGKIARPKIPVAINQDLKALFLNDGIDKTYMEYAWRSQESQIQAMGTGTTVKGIRLEDIRGLEIAVAPSAEQTRIADQLDALLARVQTCNDRFDAIPELLKRFRKTVLDAAGSGELTEYWRNKSAEKINSAELIAALMESLSIRPSSKKFSLSTKDAPIAFNNEKLPAGWLITRIGFVGNVSNGSTPSRKQISYWNGNIPWVSSGEVANGIIRNTREKISEEGFEKTSIHLLPKGTVLIAMIGEGKTRGQSALLDIDACINQNVAGVAPFKDFLDSKYLWYWFQREYENTRTKGNGSGPKALNCERVRELEINLPPLAEQTEIVRRVEALFALADRIEARYTAARAHAQRLTPLLLAKAFRGELVSQDPNDEAASALLQRIAAQRAQTDLLPKIRKPRTARAARAPKETAGMTKRRQDADVKDQPYLADHLRRLGGAHTAEALFKVAELPVADFYKQLAWEVDKGYIKDHKTALEAGHAP